MIKSVAKGMVVGKVRGGGQVVVGGGDGGVVPEQDIQRYDEKNNQSGYGGSSGGSVAGGPSFTPQAGPYAPVGFGNSAGGVGNAPPAYQEFGQKR